MPGVSIEESQELTRERDAISGLFCERTNLGLTLRIGQRAELRSHAAGDGRRLTPGLEAGEVGTIAPGNRTAQPNARLQRGVMVDTPVDRSGGRFLI